jgi:hypothetical protein
MVTSSTIPLVIFRGWFEIEAVLDINRRTIDIRVHISARGGAGLLRSVVRRLFQSDLQEVFDYAKYSSKIAFPDIVILKTLLLFTSPSLVIIAKWYCIPSVAQPYTVCLCGLTLSFLMKSTKVHEFV